MIGRPRSRSGRAALGLAALFAAMCVVNQIAIARGWSLPWVWAVALLLCGLGSGALAVRAWRRDGDRSAALWLALLPAALVLFFLIGEALGPH